MPNQAKTCQIRISFTWTRFLRAKLFEDIVVVTLYQNTVPKMLFFNL